MADRALPLPVDQSAGKLSAVLEGLLDGLELSSVPIVEPPVGEVVHVDGLNRNLARFELPDLHVELDPPVLARPHVVLDALHGCRSCGDESKAGRTLGGHQAQEVSTADRIELTFGDVVQRTAHDLASMEGVDLAEARPAVVRLWQARGLALHHLAGGDDVEAAKVMAPFKPGDARHG